jgi:hypothetical protein
VAGYKRTANTLFDHQKCYEGYHRRTSLFIQILGGTEQTIVLNSTSDRKKLAVRDGEGETLSNTANARYIIFSACGYGNMGDDAIMLGTVRYLITRQTAVIRKGRVDLARYDTLRAFCEFGKGFVINN